MEYLPVIAVWSHQFELVIEAVRLVWACYTSLPNRYTI